MQTLPFVPMTQSSHFIVFKSVLLVHHSSNDNLRPVVVSARPKRSTMFVSFARIGNVEMKESGKYGKRLRAKIEEVECRVCDVDTYSACRVLL
jgi:hypothetical protein